MNVTEAFVRYYPRQSSYWTLLVSLNGTKFTFSVIHRAHNSMTWHFVAALSYHSQYRKYVNMLAQYFCQRKVNKNNTSI